MANEIGDAGRQDLPEPGGELGLAGSAEQLEVAMGLEEGFLNEIGGIDFSLEPATDFEAREQMQVVAIVGEENAEVAAATGLLDLRFRIAHRSIQAEVREKTSARSSLPLPALGERAGVRGSPLRRRQMPPPSVGQQGKIENAKVKMQNGKRGPVFHFALCVLH